MAAPQTYPATIRAILIWSLKAVPAIAHVTYSVPVQVGLVWIWYGGTVIDRIYETVTVRIIAGINALVRIKIEWAVVTYITKSIAICIRLVWVGMIYAVVTCITNSIPICIFLIKAAAVIGSIWALGAHHLARAKICICIGVYG